MIKLKDPPLSKRKSTLSMMGLLCFCFVGLGCSLKAPKYIIDIDRLTDTAPETSDKRLKEMVSVQLVHEDKYGNHDDVVEEWLVGKVSFRRYELMEEPPQRVRGAHTDRYTFQPLRANIQVLCDVQRICRPRANAATAGVRLEGYVKAPLLAGCVDRLH